MAAALMEKRINFTHETALKAQSADLHPGVSLALKNSQGGDVPLPAELQHTLLSILHLIAEQDSPGAVSIGHVPEELTSTVAADLLGVSRPTLMKWAKNGEIESFKVGSHTRFHREDVFALKEARRAQRRRALQELRELDAENEELLSEYEEESPRSHRTVYCTKGPVDAPKHR